MARKSKLLPFEEARELIHAECIQSRKSYYDWYDKNKPAKIPRQPHRAYAKLWEGWNNWLGNNNEFKHTVRKKWRNFAEAIVYVHNLKIKNHEAYYDFAREGKLPDDIPTRPDIVYKEEWVSWNHWLGNKPKELIEAQQQVQDIGILYIVQLTGRPGNVYKIGVAKGGKSQISDMQKSRSMRVVKLFKLRPDYDWQSHVLRYGSEWTGSDVGGEYFFSNVHEMLFTLDLDWA